MHPLNHRQVLGIRTCQAVCAWLNLAHFSWDLLKGKSDLSITTVHTAQADVAIDLVEAVELQDAVAAPAAPVELLEEVVLGCEPVAPVVGEHEGMVVDGERARRRNGLEEEQGVKVVDVSHPAEQVEDNAVVGKLSGRPETS